MKYHNHHKRILRFAGYALIVLLIGISVSTYKRSKEYRIQQEIAQQIIRFHVRANSDSQQDQALKLSVKDTIVQFLQKELQNAATLDEARNILYDDKDQIKELAMQVIAKEGYSYTVDVYSDTSYFPMKTYGDMTFPPGEYEAFCVDIGEAEGKNWWCVLYPPLCFVDSTYSVVPDETKELFQNVLSEDAYEMITMNDLHTQGYEIRFKYLTFLNKFFE